MSKKNAGKKNDPLKGKLYKEESEELSSEEEVERPKRIPMKKDTRVSGKFSTGEVKIIEQKKEGRMSYGQVFRGSIETRMLGATYPRTELLGEKYQEAISEMRPRVNDDEKPVEWVERMSPLAASVLNEYIRERGLKKSSLAALVHDILAGVAVLLRALVLDTTDLEWQITVQHLKAVCRYMDGWARFLQDARKSEQKFGNFSKKVFDLYDDEAEEVESVELPDDAIEMLLCAIRFREDDETDEDTYASEDRMTPGMQMLFWIATARRVTFPDMGKVKQMDCLLEKGIFEQYKKYAVEHAPSNEGGSSSPKKKRG